MLPSVIILSAVAVVALLLTHARQISENEVARRSAARSLAVAVGAQTAHFAEEAATGLHRQLPALLGQPAMPFSVFLLFNMGWLAIWAASVPHLRSGRPAAFFAAWFLAIAGVFNGIAHPLLAVAAGGYFPGLVSSPVIGVAGALVWIRLHQATQREVFG
jgi:hypothetical protein